MYQIKQDAQKGTRPDPKDHSKQIEVETSPAKTVCWVNGGMTPVIGDSTHKVVEVESLEAANSIASMFNTKPGCNFKAIEV